MSHKMVCQQLSVSRSQLHVWLKCDQLAKWKWIWSGKGWKWGPFVKMLWIGLDLGEGHQLKTIR